MELEFHQLDLRYEGLRVRRPDRERRLLASLAERGQQVPIVVICLPEEPNRFLVIDGYKRIRALQRLGQDTVRATVWDMDETEALCWTGPCAQPKEKQHSNKDGCWPSCIAALDSALMISPGGSTGACRGSRAAWRWCASCPSLSSSTSAAERSERTRP